jgi:adenylate cyclase
MCRCTRVDFLGGFSGVDQPTTDVDADVTVSTTADRRISLMARIVRLAEQIGADSQDSEDLRLRKITLLRMVWLFALAGLVWGIGYFFLGEPRAGLIPFLYGVFSVLSIVVFAITRRFRLFRTYQLVLILVLPFLLMMALGGFIKSSVVILWSIICPIGALVFSDRRQSILWFVTYAGLVILSGFLQSTVAESGSNLTDITITIFFVANIVAVSTLVFSMLYYFLHQLHQEQQKSTRLLLNVLPASIVPLLKNSAKQTIAQQYESVSILFADVVGFTQLSLKLNPTEMVELLNRVFSYFDSLIDKWQVEKIRTIGDNYMVVAGAPVENPDHAQVLTRIGLEMLAYLESPANSAGGQLQFRIGINSGPIVAGIIGQTKFHYDVWGDAVNTASRMESHGVPGKIQITEATRELLADSFICHSRGMVEIKGKGLMQTWLVEAERDTSD